MHIAYVVKRYPRYSETFIVNEILAHEAAGCKVSIYALQSSEDTHFQDIISEVRAPVTYLPRKAYRASSFWQQLAQAARLHPQIWASLSQAADCEAHETLQAAALAMHIQDDGITHIHAHFGSSATTVSRLASMFSGVAYSTTLHAKDIFHEDTDFIALKKKIEDAKLAITISDFNVAYLNQKLDLPAGCVRRIYNGLDLQRFTYTAKSDVEKPSEEARSAHKIVSVGRLVEKKGFRYLIDACQRLVEKGLMFSCQIIGTGELMGELEAQIVQLGLSEYVAMTGALPQKEVIKHIRSADVFVAPCIVGNDNNMDGIPTVLLEAMALGTPCISTNVTGIAEAVIDQETGFMVEPGQATPLADVITQVLSDRVRSQRIALQARQHIERNFNVRDNAEMLRAVFEA